MNKKGFTLVELLAVTVLLILVAVITIINVLPTAERNRKKSFINEALTISEGARNMYLDNKLNGVFLSDAFNGTAYQNRNDGKDKACIPYYFLVPAYVNKISKKYTGSVEVCYGDNCDYNEKIWLTDGEFYINGKVADGKLSKNDLSETKTGFNNYLTCGVDVSTTKAAYNYDYSGGEQKFIVPANGVYSIEAWGAQGGETTSAIGGFGGYAYIEANLTQGDIIYINVGGKGEYQDGNNEAAPGGYNGGTYGKWWHAGGGGATSIAMKSGILSTPITKDYLYAVAGGGGGGSRYNPSETQGGSGGGFKDETGYNTQTSPQYGKATNDGGGGGGYFATDKGRGTRPRGGSGYIGNPITRNGVMYGYNVPESEDTYTKTVSTTNASEVATSQYAKKGNGAARITYIGNFSS